VTIITYPANSPFCWQTFIIWWRKYWVVSTKPNTVNKQLTKACVCIGVPNIKMEGKSGFLKLG